MKKKNEIVLKNNLRKVRATKKWSQAKLAEMVGVSRQTIIAIENGQFCPTAKLAALFCVAFDMTFEELFYLEEE